MIKKFLNSLSTNHTKCPNTIKQFVGNSRLIAWVYLTILRVWSFQRRLIPRNYRDVFLISVIRFIPLAYICNLIRKIGEVKVLSVSFFTERASDCHTQQIFRWLRKVKHHILHILTLGLLISIKKVERHELMKF